MISRYQSRSFQQEYSFVKFSKLLITAVTCVILGGVIPHFSSTSVASTLFLCIASILLLFVLRQSRFTFQESIFTIYVLGFFSIFDIFGYQPILNEPIKVYFADGALILLFIYIFMVVAQKKSLSTFKTPLTTVLVLNLLYGGISFFLGYESGHELNEILGDFRRFFVYPLVIFVPTIAFSKKINLRKLIFFLGLSLIPISYIALWRVSTGQTWDPDQFAASGDLRAIGYFTGVIVLMGIAVGYGYFLSTVTYLRWLILLIVVLLIGITVVSGYRLLWILALCTPIAVSWLTSRGVSRIRLSMVTIGTVILFSLLINWILEALASDWYHLIQEKFMYQVLQFDYRSNIRYYIWKQLWLQFLGSPLTGIGIGDSPLIVVLNSMGDYYLRAITPHNIFLSLLYQTGVIGVILFLLINFILVKQFFFRLNQSEFSTQGLLAGMLVAYACALIVGTFQPALESPGPTVAFYLWSGMIFALTNTGDPKLA